MRKRSKRLADWIRCRGGTVHPYLNIFKERKMEIGLWWQRDRLPKVKCLYVLRQSCLDARADRLPPWSFFGKGFIHAALCTMSYVLLKGKDDAYVECLNGANVHPSDDEIVSKLLSGTSYMAEEYVARKPEMTLWYEGKLRENVLNIQTFGLVMRRELMKCSREFATW